MTDEGTACEDLPCANEALRGPQGCFSGGQLRSSPFGPSSRPGSCPTIQPVRQGRVARAMVLTFPVVCSPGSGFVVSRGN